MSKFFGFILKLALLFALLTPAIAENFTVTPGGSSSSITAGTTPCTGCTNGDLLGVASGKVSDTGIAAAASTADTQAGGSIGIGAGALTNQAASTAYGNTAVGFNAMSGAITTAGVQNAAVGFDALLNLTSGADNVAVGHQALKANTSGMTNTAVGFAALFANVTAANNTAIGAFSLFANTVAGSTAVGYGTLQANTTGTNNTAMGFQALNANIAGTGNTAVGAQAMLSGTAGVNNTAIGFLALSANLGDGNVGIGYHALENHASGDDNTAIGYRSLESDTGGVGNVAVGTGAMQGNLTGNQNTALGVDAFINNTSGGNNTVVGFNTGLGITTGSNNTIVGAQVSGLSSSLAGAIILAAGDGTIRADYGKTTAATWTLTGPAAITGLGNTATTSALCYNTGTGLITYDGTIGTCTVSAIRFKDLFVRQPLNLDGLDALRTDIPWTYRHDTGFYDGRIRVGLLADDVERMDPRCVVRDETGLRDYDERCLIAYLVADRTRAKADTDKIRAELDVLKKRIN